jgi:hypothetical protein
MEVKRHFGETCLHLLLFKLVAYLAYSSTFKMEATYFSDVSGDFQQTIRRDIPEDRTLDDGKF